MSALYDQSIIDAKKLREAALNSAKEHVFEKYNVDVKKRIDELLEVDDSEEDPLNVDFGSAPEEEMSLDTLGGEEAPIPMDADPAQTAPAPETSIDSSVPTGAADGMKLCPCPDNEEEIELEFSMDDLRDLSDSMDDGELETQDDLATDVFPEDELLREVSNILLREDSSRKTIYIPGGFKPPHRGHLSLITKSLAAYPNGNVVLVSGATPRGNITLEDTTKVFDIYLKNEGYSNKISILEVDSKIPVIDLETKKQKINKDGKPSFTSSPMVKLINDVLMQEKRDIVVVASKEDPQNAETAKRLLERSLPGVQVEALIVDTIADPETVENKLSATEMREAIENDNFEEFKKYLPESSMKDADTIWEILKKTPASTELGQVQESEQDEIERLAEELIVDLSGADLTGWAGRPQSDVQYAQKIQLANMQDTKKQEDNDKLKKAVKDLTESLRLEKAKSAEYAKNLLTISNQLKEINLTNAKLHYSNRALADQSLNGRQKSYIVESVQRAVSVEEVKVIYNTLQKTVTSGPNIKQDKTLSESIRRTSNVFPHSTTANSEEKEMDVMQERLQKLAGIKKTN